MRQDAVNKAKAFDEKHQLRANASERISSFDKRVGLSEKINNGVSVVNEKVKSVNQRLQVSDKTMAALLAAERKLNDTGSAVKTNWYLLIRFCNSVNAQITSSDIMYNEIEFLNGFCTSIIPCTFEVCSDLFDIYFIYFIADLFSYFFLLPGMCMLEQAG
jgi:hypothetical protein